jgi:hypothetical protein
MESVLATTLPNTMPIGLLVILIQLSLPLIIMIRRITDTTKQTVRPSA